MAKYEDLTGDEFQIHLFNESGDAHMQKIATELLGKENPIMQQLKIKVKESENATWYNQKRAKIRKEKFCKPFDSKTHKHPPTKQPIEQAKQQ